MTQAGGPSLRWPLLTISKIRRPFHLEKIPLKSLCWNILPLSLTRSRFCGQTFQIAQCHQDFRDIPGEGYPQYLVVRCRWPEEHMVLASGYYQELAAPVQSHPSQQQASTPPTGNARSSGVPAWMGHPRTAGSSAPLGMTPAPGEKRITGMRDRAHKFPLWAPSGFFTGLAQTRACTLKSNPLQAGSIRGSHSLVSVGVQICSKDLHV